MGLKRPQALALFSLAGGFFYTICCVSSAWAQFNGYVGLQTVYTPVILNTTVTGRTTVNANIGASYHTFTYCLSTPTTAIQLFIEESPNGQPGSFTQISPISEFPWQAINGNNCGIIRVGGYYSVLAVNIILLSGGTASVWYTATAGPTDIFPPAVNSSGGTSPVACDQTVVFTALAPSATYELVRGNPNQGIYVCGGVISFSAATTPGSVDLSTGNVGCGGPVLAARRPGRRVAIAPRTPAKPNGRPPSFAAGTGVWFSYITATSPQLFPINSTSSAIRIPPSSTGSSLCFDVGPVGASTGVSLIFAQF